MLYLLFAIFAILISKAFNVIYEMSRKFSLNRNMSKIYGELHLAIKKYKIYR